MVRLLERICEAIGPQLVWIRLLLDRPRNRRILSEVTAHYLGSRDFNGLAVAALASRQGENETRRGLEILLREGAVCLEFGDRHANPHIHALEYESVETQLSKLDGPLRRRACVYPSPTHLERVVDPTEYKNQPYTLRLALGAPQLQFATFDLSVLEYYRNDPRYYYSFSDVSGQISIRSDYAQTGALPSHDQVLLQSFGIALDDEENIYVAAFLRYLSDLTPEHQQLWAAKEVAEQDGAKLHPNYYDSSIRGDFPERISLFDAVLLEMKTVNDLATHIAGVPFFREDYYGARPREFGYLLRPTRREFDAFVHLLDKMLGDNINRAFFGNEVAKESEHMREDGRVVVQPKGTIQLLEDWLKSKFRFEDWSPIQHMLRTFRDVRAMRQRPAHTIEEDVFDRQFTRQQRDLMLRVYGAVKTLRQALALHPRTRGVSIDRHLVEGLVWQI